MSEKEAKEEEKENLCIGHKASERSAHQSDGQFE